MALSYLWLLRYVPPVMVVPDHLDYSLHVVVYTCRILLLHNFYLHQFPLTSLAIVDYFVLSVLFSTHVSSFSAVFLFL